FFGGYAVHSAPRAPHTPHQRARASPLHVEQSPGVSAKTTPRRRDGDARTEALEEGRIKLLLELADLRADGRLRTETRLRGFGKALQPDDFQKRMQLVQVHSRAQRSDRRAGPRLPACRGIATDYTIIV